MVYDAETFEVLHGLTPEGEIEYRKVLEEEADRILFRHAHPFRYALSQAKEFLEWLLWKISC